MGCIAVDDASDALDAEGRMYNSVEVHLANGLPCFTLVGLADVEVKEARVAAENRFLSLAHAQRGAGRRPTPKGS